MKKLFLHVGYPKTGTTALQAFFQSNAEVLALNGVLYPRTGRLNGAHYLLNFSLGIAAYDCPIPVPEAHALKEELRREIDASPCETVIISSEYFITTKDVEALSKFFSGYDLKVVVYLRRHDYVFESAFAQGEKTAVNPPWDSDIASFTLYTICANQVPFDYLVTLRRWAGVFGTERIIVRPFEKQQNQPDLYADFLAAVNVPDSPDYGRPPTTNSSLSRETLSAIRLIRRSALPAAAREKAVSRLIGSNRGGASERYFAPAMRNVVVGKYAPSYRVIAREFLGREDGLLFMDRMPKAADEWTAPVAPEPADVVARAFDAISALLK